MPVPDGATHKQEKVMAGTGARDRSYSVGTGRYVDTRGYYERRKLNYRGVMERVDVATAESPIIIYRTDELDKFTTAFGASLKSKRHLVQGHDGRGNIVAGMFHRGNCPEEIKRKLSRGFLSALGAV